MKTKWWDVQAILPRWLVNLILWTAALNGWAYLARDVYRAIRWLLS